MRSKKLRKQQIIMTPLKRKKPKARRAVAARGAKAADILGRVATAATPPGRVSKKWRWHYAVLLSLQNRLVRERRDLLSTAAQPLEAHSLDEADSATDEFDHDLALSRLSVEQDALYEVNEALSRIVNGGYGVCQESGRAIPAPRLRAIPWTRFTREVEERLENRGIVRRARLGKPATVRNKGRIWLAPEEEAEETEEKPPAPPKDEALSRASGPRGWSISRQKNLKRPLRAAKRKGPNK